MNLRNLLRLAVILCVLSGCVLVTGGLFAQEEGGSQDSSPSAGEAPAAEAPQESASKAPPTILSVEVRGNQLVNSSTIVSKLKSHEGNPLVQEVVNEDIKRLYGTGFFQDIRAEVSEEPDGVKLIFSVVEKPVVKQIVIEGAKLFKPDKLRKEINIVEGQILDPKLVKDGVDKIREKYLGKGFKFVDVRWDVSVDEQSKMATVTIRIQEGEKYKIREVQFEGVKAFKVRKLRRMMKTKKDSWFTSGVFEESKFKEDLDKLQGFYENAGFLDVKISPEFRYDDRAKKMIILIRVEEGNRYVAGEINIEGNLLFPRSDIQQNLSMLPGTVFSQKRLVEDAEAIRNYYFEKGYIDVRIIPETRMNKETGRVDLLYRISEGDLYFIDKVKIRGNTKTKDIVIRRELRVHPGERFDGKKMDRSKQRLENLNYFQEVAYDTEPGSAANKRDVIFRVKEKQTGELSFGAGVSSVETFLAFAEISQRNFDWLNWPRFTGGGQSVSLRGRMGSLTRDYEFSFVEPYLFNRPYSLGLSVYDTTHFKNNTHFDENRYGFSVNLSKAFTDYVRSGFAYTLENVKLKDLSDGAPEEVTKYAKNTLLSRLRWFISRDSRDNIMNPTEGSYLSFSSELIGTVLGGDADYYILQASASKYYNINKKHIFEFRLRLGTGDGISSTDRIPVFDRFYAGGLGSVRGIDVRRVGPQDAGEAVGGETLAVFNIEYTFPIIQNFKGAWFIDMGTVGADSYDFGTKHFAASTGPGVKINTPIGPVAFYYGFPLRKPDDDGNDWGRFEFSFSRGF
ncbi:MAG TPA: outer membrane protein assembly factor BamA [Candidatus Omnitrophota bacterium]|nr:outer membrane protein assembly factor BamA [Candidatus Omnitrophota bacterium]